MVEAVAPVNAAMSRTPGLSRRKAWSEARRSVATVRTSGQAKRNSSTSIPKGAGGQPVQHQVAPNTILFFAFVKSGVLIVAGMISVMLIGVPSCASSTRRDSSMPWTPCLAAV